MKVAYINVTDDAETGLLVTAWDKADKEIELNGTTYEVHDDAAVLTFFAENSAKSVEEFVKKALSNEAFWGEDLTAYEGMEETVSTWLTLIREDASVALKKVLGM